MNTTSNLQKWFMLFITIFVLVIFQLFLLKGIATAGTVVLKPTAYIDYAGKTTNAAQAYDGAADTFAVTTTDADCFPSIMYTWQTSEIPYSGLTLCVERKSSGHVDDKWGIKYSMNGGITWLILDPMLSRNLDPGSVSVDLGPSQNLASIQVRIDSDRVKGADNGRVEIYDIRIEAEQTIPLSLEQSAYRFFQNIDSVDLTAIVSNVGGDDEATAVKIYNGYMYIAGYQPGGWRIEKRQLDDGYLVAEATNSCRGTPNSMVIANGYLYIVGDEYSEGNYKWRIEVRDGDLSLVGDFGDGGVVISNPSPENESAYEIAIADNVIYVVGSDRTNGPTDSRWRIEERSLFDGSLLRLATSNPSVDDDIPFGIAVDVSSVYVVGYDRIPGSLQKPGKGGKGQSNAEWRIEKRSRSNLELSTSVTSNPTGNFDTARAVAIDGDYIYVVGCQEMGFFDMDWRIEKRDLATLSLDTTFGGSGSKVLDYGYDDQPQAIAIDPQFMYVAGHSASVGGGGDTAWQLEKIDLSSGTTEYSVTNDIFADRNDGARAIDIHSSYMYVAGWSNPGLPEWRIEKRDLSTGSLVFPPPLANQDSPIFKPSDKFRLRMLIHVTSGTLFTNSGRFKLQLSSSDPDSWTDIADATAIAFSPNPTPVNGDALMPGPDDPNNGRPIKYQTYVDTNDFTNSISTVQSDEDGMWDFSLAVNGSAAPGTYKLRVVDANESPIAVVYTQTPTLEIVSNGGSY